MAIAEGLPLSLMHQLSTEMLPQEANHDDDAQDQEIRREAAVSLAFIRFCSPGLRHLFFAAELKRERDACHNDGRMCLEACGVSCATFLSRG